MRRSRASPRAAGPLPDAERGTGYGWQPPLRQAERAIDWARDDTATVLRKIHSADGFPGVEDLLFGHRFRLFDAHPESHLTGTPGALIARRHGAHLPRHARRRGVDRPVAAG